MDLNDFWIAVFGQLLRLTGKTIWLTSSLFVQAFDTLRRAKKGKSSVELL